MRFTIHTMLRLAVAGLGLALIAGCVVRVPAAPGRVRLEDAPIIADEDWPMRARARVQLEIADADHPMELAAVTHSRQGTLYSFRSRAGFDRDVARSAYSTNIVDEHGASIVRGTHRVSDTPTHERGSWYLFASYPAAVLTITGDDGGSETTFMRWQQPMISFILVEEPAEPSPRGTVVFLNGLGGSTFGERALARELSERGWRVIRVTPALDAIEQLTFQLQDEEELPRVAQVIGEQIDNTLAERAYAVETMLGYLQREQVIRPDQPMVAVGCSAGAINLPAVAARLPATFDAAVVVGGGADLARIAMTSDLLRSRLRLRIDGRRPNADEQSRLGALVLASSILDPHHMASHIADIPVLMLHAQFDRIVPAVTGDALYERLDRPERWSYPLGHFGLFAWLAWETDDIADWIDRHVY
jgi:alpha-beta hydrolase superfamily lysophospholipase